MNSTLNNGVFAVATTPYAPNGEQNLEALDQGITVPSMPVSLACYYLAQLVKH